MRTISWLLILLGIFLLGHAIHDEQRGVATAVSPMRGRGKITIHKTADLEQFRGLMAYQWLLAALVLGAGAGGLALCLRADRLGPFHVS